MSTSAIVVPPVVTDVINPKFWPDFPWAKLKPSYDVWIPMSYYTNRDKQPEWRDAYKYSAENVKLLRKHLGATTQVQDRKSTRLNSSHANISYAVFCLKKKRT